MSNKRINLKASSEVATVYAKHTKTFLDIAKKYDYSECGVVLKNSDDLEHFVQLDSPETAVHCYKKVIEMIDLNEIERIKMQRGLLQKIKSDVLKLQPGFYATATAFWLLFGEKDAKYATYLISLVLLGSIDFGEAFKLMKGYLAKPEKRAVLETDLCEFGVSEYVSQCESREAASLYLKIEDGFKSKK